MKVHTLRGRVEEGEIKRLIVDDGRLTHAMKVIGLWCCADETTSVNDAKITLSLQSSAPIEWDWGDNRQIAWASTNLSNVAGADNPFMLIDPNHLVINDLYISGRVGTTGGNSYINYLVLLQAQDISEDQSVLQLIKERSQNVTR
jgi:hypothetical protein